MIKYEVPNLTFQVAVEGFTDCLNARIRAITFLRNNAAVNQVAIAEVTPEDLTFLGVLAGEPEMEGKLITGTAN